MSVRECGTCEFWLKRSDHAGGSGGGYCVRFPPFAPNQYNVSRNGDGTQSVSLESRFLNDAWPMTSRQSWCGEWNPSPETVISQAQSKT